MEILIYGAGNNALHLWADKLKTSDEYQDIFNNAVAFIDKDPNKQGKLFLGKRVLSVEEGLSMYPQAKIYISLMHKKEVYGEIFEDLSNRGVSHDRLINCRRTCDYLERFLVCGYHEGAFGGKAGSDHGTHSLKPCCSDYGKNQVDSVIIRDDLESAFTEYLSMRNKLIENLRSNTECCCSGCPMIYYSDRPIIEEFSYIIYNELGRCNCKCYYCNFEERLGRDVSADVDIVELYRLVKQFGYNDQEGIIELCNGEITIHPDKSRIYEGLENTNVMFLTNGIVYDEEIRKRMMNGTAILNVSIDSGTSETFKKIKGIDAFSRVVNNLKLYANNKKGIFNLKYILLPGDNDNDADIEGFVELCKNLHVDMAHISYDLNREYEDYNNPQMIRAINKLVYLLQEKNIPYEIYSKEIIEQLLNSGNGK